MRKLTEKNNKYLNFNIFIYRTFDNLHLGLLKILNFLIKKNTKKEFNV